MISKLVYLSVVLFSLSLSAQTNSNSAKECNIRIQGGVDGFPWSVARPFPWSNIQGIWQMKDGGTPTYLKAKVTRATSNRKILNLTVISESSCSKPIAKGVGYIDSTDKNVVRAIMNDGYSKYQMKLALFDVHDLLSDTFGCEDNVMAASIQVLGSIQSLNTPTAASPVDSNNGPENIMLKKISDDLGFICKKSGIK